MSFITFRARAESDQERQGGDGAGTQRLEGMRISSKKHPKLDAHRKDPGQTKIRFCSFLQKPDIRKYSPVVSVCCQVGASCESETFLRCCHLPTQPYPSATLALCSLCPMQQNSLRAIALFGESKHDITDEISRTVDALFSSTIICICRTDCQSNWHTLTRPVWSTIQCI